MSDSQELMKKRLEHAGGTVQRDRMDLGKLRSLKRALLYSYQAGTAVLEDGRNFRCLMNPNRSRIEYDDKIISIPFEDVSLGKTISKTYASTGVTIKQEEPPTGLVEKIGMKVGDSFIWRENGSHWIVYSQKLEERAYFRADVRKAEYELEIEGRHYWAYVKTPDEDSLWHTKNGLSWSELGFTVEMYVKKDETTENYFHRFQTIKIKDKPWEIQFVDDISSEEMLIIALKEAYINVFDKDDEDEEAEIDINPNEEIVDETPISTGKTAIIGKEFVYPYDRITYIINAAAGGAWFIEGDKAKIVNQDETTAVVEVTSGRSGTFNVIYKREGEENIVKRVTIKSL